MVKERPRRESRGVVPTPNVQRQATQVHKAHRHKASREAIPERDDPICGRMLDLGQFDLGQSVFIRLRPLPELGQFELGQFDLGQFDLGQLGQTKIETFWKVTELID